MTCASTDSQKGSSSRKSYVDEFVEQIRYSLREILHRNKEYGFEFQALHILDNYFAGIKVAQPQFEKLRAAMPENLHHALTFCYESGCRIGAMKKVVWPWVDLDTKEISFPRGVVKNGESLVVPLSAELVAMLRKKFQGTDPVFDTTNFRREWNRACIRTGLGKRTGKQWYQYEGLIPHDLRRSAARNLVRAGIDMTTAMKITGHRTLDLMDVTRSDPLPPVPPLLPSFSRAPQPPLPPGL